MKKLLITLTVLAAAVTLVLLAGTVSSESGETDAAERATATAARMDLEIVVTENGYLKAKNSANIVPQFDREGVIMTLVEEGKEVEKDEVLIEFDKTEIENQMDELETRLIQYETELEAAVANLAIQKKDDTSAIKKAELALEIARLELEKYLEGEGPNAERKARLAVEKSESEHERAKEKMDQVPELLSEGFLTRDQAKEEEFRLREAEINLENARTDLELLLKYTHPMQVKQKTSDTEEKERELQRTKEKAAINLKEKEARVTRQERQVQSTKARLETLRKEAGHMTIKAPKPGVVMYGDPARPWEMDRIKVGNRVWSGMTLLTIPDLAEMQCLVQIHEADINKVEEGQSVVVTVDTHKDKTFTGKVSKVAKVATSQGWRSSSGNKKFQVEILMAQSEVKLLAGITAKVQILIEEIDEQLVLPIHSVFNEGGDQFCFVTRAGAIERTTLQLGKHNDHYVVIKDGLSEGDEVLLYDPRKEGYSETGREESENEEPEDAGIPLASAG